MLWSVVLTDIEGRSPLRIHTPSRTRDVVKVSQSLKGGFAIGAIEIRRVCRKFEAFALVVHVHGPLFTRASFLTASVLARGGCAWMRTGYYIKFWIKGFPGE